MSTDRRNPYLVLGVPYGTSRAEATRAFAERSRRARREGDFPYSVDDLTWALHQIEAYLDDPSAAIDHFRVPADPATLQPPSGPGLLRPPAVPLERRTPPTDPAELQHLRDLARQDVVDILLDRAAERATAVHLSEPLQVPVEVQLASKPKRQRSLWPWFIGLAALAVGGVVAGAAIMVQNQEAPATTSPPVTAAPTSTSAAPSTTAEPPPPTFGDPIELDGLTLRPTLPINAFGLLCAVFEVSGEAPLVFLPEMTTVTMNGTTVVYPSLEITTGRAPLGPVYGEPSPQTREVCWPAEGWENSALELRYEFDGLSFVWTASPSAEGSVAADLRAFLNVFERTEAVGLEYIAARNAAEDQFRTAWDGTGTESEFSEAGRAWVLSLSSAAAIHESKMLPLVDELNALAINSPEVVEIREHAVAHYTAWRDSASALSSAADEWVTGPILDFADVADDFDLPSLDDQIFNTWTSLCDSLLTTAATSADDSYDRALTLCEP